MEFTLENIERWRAEVARRREELFGVRVRDAPADTSGPGIVFRGAKFPGAAKSYARQLRAAGMTYSGIATAIRQRFGLVVNTYAVKRAVQAVVHANKETA